MADNKGKPPMITVFEGDQVKTVETLVNEIKSLHMMVEIYMRLATIAMGKLGKNVVVRIGDKSPLPWKLDFFADKHDDGKLTFTAVASTPEPEDPRLSEAQVLKTAMVGAYDIHLIKASGRDPADIFSSADWRAPKIYEMIHPSLGMQILQKAHWATMDPKLREGHLEHARDWLQMAVRLGEFPDA